MPDDAWDGEAQPASGEAPLLDRAFLEAQTFGDAALAAELLALFREQCGRLVPVIADAGRGAHERADAAHTLRGAAQALGARRLAGLAARLEAALAEAADAGRTGALAVALGRAAEATLAEAATTAA
jgi:HPt (histidine-containing phosphotransfer) domain-containing protein